MTFRMHPTIATIDMKAAKKSRTVSSSSFVEVTVKLCCFADNPDKFAELFQVSCVMLIQSEQKKLK